MKIGRKFSSVLLVLAMVVSLFPSAMAKADTPEGSAVKSVEVLPQNITLELNKSAEVTAIVVWDDPENPGTLTKENVTWTTENNSDPIRINVQQDPDDPLKLTITAVGIAETTETKPVTIKVSITYGSGEAKTATTDVTVRPAQQPSITIDQDDVELEPGDSTTLTATVFPDPTQAVSWRSSDTSIATVDPETGAVTAGTKPGVATITATSGTLDDTCTVTVRGIVLNEESITINRYGNYTLKATVYGEALQGRVITWATSDSSVVTVDSGYLYGVSVGEAKITVSAGTAYNAVCQVTVKSNTAAAIEASVEAGEPLAFSTLRSEFQDRASTVLGRSLSYISGLSVPTDQGTLYYYYESESDTGSGVGAAEWYYASPGTGQLDLSNITFVPKGGFSGTAVINYTGYVSGAGFFQGTIEVSVGAQGDVTYSTANGQAIQFDPEDFAQACRISTGRDLKYVTFTLPDSGTGTLTYQYLSSQNPGTPVRATTEYYYTGSPALSGVYFVPADGFAGEAVITYTGWDANRQSFQGYLVIRVEDEVEEGSVQYDVVQGNSVTFDDTDFNTLCRELTGSSLNYVRFTLPSETQGTLYYGSTSSSSNKVTEAKKYYRSSSPYLDDVIFLAEDNVVGTVYIPFTGQNISGGYFSGTVSIRVTKEADVVSYQVYPGGWVEFDAEDFNDISLDVTGQTLRYVRFTLPSTSRGTLYYDYDDGDYARKVSSYTNYYRSQSSYLDQVSFVPAASFDGTASIAYTGWTTGGKSFKGTVEIEVLGQADAADIVYSTAYRPVTFRAADFEDACSKLSIGTLEYVEFDTTSVPGGGRLYRSYNGLLDDNNEVNTGVKYYPEKSPNLSEVTFVPQAGYQGTVSLTYTGTTTRGYTYQGQVRIVVKTSTASGYFSDVTSNYSWAAASIDLLYENGVVNGVGGGLFAPAQPITRGSFLAMLDRALAFPRTAQQYFPDVPAGSYYAEAIQSAYGLGIVNGYSDGSFHPDAPLTRADAAVILHRALEVMDRSVGTENTALLGAFSDGYTVPQYAREAMSVMLQTGIIGGTSEGKLEPVRNMTRAEMAVVLARTLTLAL